MHSPYYITKVGVATYAVGKRVIIIPGKPTFQKVASQMGRKDAELICKLLNEWHNAKMGEVG